MTISQSAGYLALTKNAEWAKDRVFQKHAEFAKCWSGLLDLYYMGLKGEHVSPYGNDEALHVAWHLRQSLSSAAIDTSKMAFDATLSGYYVQAMVLVRHLWESWLQIQYAQCRPDQAFRWFNTEEHGSAREPSLESIIKEVLKSSEDKPAKIWVNSAISELGKAAHPSWWIVEQVRGTGEQLISVGGRYDQTWCIRAFERGTFATIALLLELQKLIPQAGEWQAQLASLTDLRNSRYSQYLMA